jgi:septum formation protein
MPSLILASTSTYRAELLKRLGLPFRIQAPGVDEFRIAGETPAQMAARLATAKAQAVLNMPSLADLCVIGSDQVLELGQTALGKPGSHEQAVSQLQSLSGQTVQFHTAVSVCCPAKDFIGCEIACVEVQFRQLSLAQIEWYLRQEPAYDCAGSAKSEGLGIVLMEAIHSDDPTALMGLPLIRTRRLLQQAGYDPLGVYLP